MNQVPATARMLASSKPTAPPSSPHADILERAPYRSEYGLIVDDASRPNTGDREGALRNERPPLIVLPAFLMRPDLSPESERPRDPRNLVDANDMPLDLATADPSQLAFDTNPYVVGEKWNEYWRKIHGVRFTHRDGDRDRSMALMLRYDQVHRISSGPSSMRPPPYEVPLGPDGKLYESVQGSIPEYRRPQYDGFAYMAFNSLPDLAESFGQGKFPMYIVPEERIIFRSVPHLVAAEYVIIPYRGPRPAVLLIKVHVAADGVGRDGFHERWLGPHADLVLSQVATHRFVRRYAQLHNIGPAKEGELFWHPVGSKYDGITVMEFVNMSDLEDYLMSPGYRAIEEDEARLVDRDRSVYWTAINHNIIDKILNEVPTDRSRRVTYEEAARPR